MIWLLLIIIFLIIFFSYIINEMIFRKWERAKWDNRWDTLMDFFPKEALNCPFMKSKGVNLGDKKYMRKNWKKVIEIIEAGIMPPKGYEHIWSKRDKQKYIEILKNWGTYPNPYL